MLSLFIYPDGSNLPTRVSHNAGILHFHKVTRSDAGNYTCIASNNPQGEIRAMVQLTVAGTHQKKWLVLGNWESFCGQSNFLS